MIKCGKLEGKDQCILYAKDGKRPLGYFPYSKHGGQKGAEAAAHKREGAIQSFKKEHQGLLDALEAFGAPVVLKYLLDKAADCEACQEVVKSYVEKAQGEPAEEPEGEGVEKAEKSFEETAEEALLILVQKDEETDVDVDLAELEAWLKDADVAEPPATEEPTPEPAPEPEPEPEPAPEAEPEPEPKLESTEELANDFRAFLLRDHAKRQAGVVAMLGDEGEEVGDE